MRSVRELGGHGISNGSSVDPSPHWIGVTSRQVTYVKKISSRTSGVGL